jgi:hypothetical protein
MQSWDVLVDGEPLRRDGGQVTLAAHTQKSAKHQAKKRYGDTARAVPLGTASDVAKRDREASAAAAQLAATQATAAEAARLEREAKPLKREHRETARVRAPTKKGFRGHPSGISGGREHGQWAA